MDKFPIKNLEIFNKWVHKCRRGDKWNPKTSLVCSKHFTPDSFVRDLKAELLGYISKVRMIKPNAITTLHLPPDHSQSVTSTSAINRNKRIEAKSMKQYICTCIHYFYFSRFSVTIVENDKRKGVEEFLENYKKINECLRTSMNILQISLNSTNSILKTPKKTLSEEVKTLSLNKNKAIENEAKKSVSSRVRWTRDEVAKAFTLRYLSKRSYVYVKTDLHYPLSGLSSLQRWAKTIEMKNGILGDVLKIMKLNGDTLKDYEKLTVLMFDEVKISSTVEYDVLHDEFIGPHNQMQLDGIGFKVICCVSDCGGSNIGLWKALEINYQNPVFSIPCGRRIVYIPDAPHILKLVRNWFLDTEEALVSFSATELRVCHKFTKEHLSCEGPQRQRSNAIKLSVQQWLRENGVDFSPLQTLSELREIVKSLIPKEKKYELDEIALQMGHEVVRLPPYHCQYNPIELIWAHVKGEVAKNNTTFKFADVEKLLNDALDSVTVENWKKCTDHCHNLQERISSKKD
ncbi:THAP-type domain-containing protein [Aphis craccivora]|uniref:THAP-type domain-containing protein n=1 Tax=Aphis craccivora TaxID=307492 RepID=A0A6G0VZ98_APHCR|nr:THAP-type domain-containing protein [Aphis craccivora]